MVRNLLVILVTTSLFLAAPAFGQADAPQDAEQVIAETIADAEGRAEEQAPEPDMPTTEDAKAAYAKVRLVVAQGQGQLASQVAAARDEVLGEDDRSLWERFGFGFLTSLFQFRGVFLDDEAAAGTFNGRTYAAGVDPVETAGVGLGAATAIGLLTLLGAYLRRTGWLAALPLFSRIADDKLLKHPVRAQIVEFVRANPGSNVSEIARALELAWGSVTHHLDKLCSAKLLAVRRTDNQKCYFEVGQVDRRAMDAHSAVKGGTAARIAAFVRHHEAASQKQVAESLGLSRAVTSFHVRKLVDRGVLDREKVGRSVHLRLRDEVTAALDDRAATMFDLAVGPAPASTTGVAA